MNPLAHILNTSALISVVVLLSQLKIALYPFLYFVHCGTASTIIPVLPRANFTQSIQPNLSLPHTRPPLTSAINTVLAIRYSSILSTCPNHLNTLWTIQLDNSFLFQLFLTIHSWHCHQIYQTLHLKNFNFPSLSTFDTSYLCSIQCSWYNYSFIWALLCRNPQSTIAQHTVQSSLHFMPLIHYVYHIPFKSFTWCHLLLVCHLISHSFDLHLHTSST